jgi:hypothetical protein
MNFRLVWQALMFAVLVSGILFTAGIIVQRPGLTDAAFNPLFALCSEHDFQGHVLQLAHVGFKMGQVDASHVRQVNQPMRSLHLRIGDGVNAVPFSIDWIPKLGLGVGLEIVAVRFDVKTQPFPIDAHNALGADGLLAGADVLMDD